MAKRSDILAGAIDQTVDVWIQDSSSTTGGGKTGLVYNTASLVCYYRKGATGSATALTLATQTVGGAHSDGGFVEIDATNMPGLYRLDLSDTIVASAGMVTVMLKGAANMAPVLLELEVQPATGKKADVVSWLGTAAATPTVAGVPEVDVTHFNGTAGTFASGRPEVNTSHLAGTAYASADLSATMKTSVNAEVVDALATDTYAELGAVPAATSSLKDKINWLFALARNKMTQTSTTSTLRNDADSGNIGTSTVSDDGTTATRGEWS